MPPQTPASDKPIRVLIVDDHPVVRDGLKAAIAQHPDLLVCGEAAEVEEAVQMTQTSQPALILVDISLKGGSGFDLIKQVRSFDKEVKLLVVSIHEESLYAERALRVGASGYINKQEVTTNVIDAIRHVMAGEIYLSPEMTGRLLNRSIGSSSAPPGGSEIENLSDRELEVFELIGRGLSLRAIAQQLGRSIHTVQAHRENIKQKLNLASSVELSRRALQWILDSK